MIKDGCADVCALNKGTNVDRPFKEKRVLLANLLSPRMLSSVDWYNCVRNVVAQSDSREGK